MKDKDMKKLANKVGDQIKKQTQSKIFKGAMIAGAAIAAAVGVFVVVRAVRKRRSLLEGRDPKNLTRAKNIYISGNTLASYAAAAYLVSEGGYPGKSIHIYGVPAASAVTEEYGSIGSVSRALMEAIDARSDDDFDVETVLENASFSAAPKVRVMSADGSARDLCIKPDKAMLKAMARAFRKLVSSDDASQVSVAQCLEGAEGFFDSDLYAFLEMTFGIREDSRATELLSRVIALTSSASKAGLYDTLYYDFSTFSAIENYLEENGVDILRGAQITGIDASENKVSAIHAMNEGTRMTIYLNREDYVILDTGSIGDGASEGSYNSAAEMLDSVPASMSLWQDAAAKDDSFGLPEMLLEDNAEYVEFSIVDDDGYLLKKLCDKALVVPDNGVSILIPESNWKMKLTSEPYSLVPDAAMNEALETTADEGEEDVPEQAVSAITNAPQPVITVKGVFTGSEGNYVEKTMRECTGIELLYELICHMGLADEWDEIAKKIKTVMVNVLPFKNAPLRTAPTYALPELLPCDNCAMTGDFVRTNAPAATIEQQIQSGRNAAYAVLGKKAKKAKTKMPELKRL